MKLINYMETHDLKPAQMALKIVEASKTEITLSGEAVRCWANGTRMPGTIFIDLILKATNHQVTANDLHAACAEQQSQENAA